MTLLDWLKERRDNAHAIADTKSGIDHDGWLEDALYCQAALDALYYARRLLSDIDEGRRGTGRCLDHLPANTVDKLREKLAFEGMDIATGTTGPPKCRECADCEGSAHHWIEDPSDVDPDAADYACCHCEARGVECPRCDGDGLDDDGISDCPVCRGDAVILAEVATLLKVAR